MGTIVSVSTIIGVGVTTLAIMIGAIIRITRRWERLERSVQSLSTDVAEMVTQSRVEMDKWYGVMSERVRLAEDGVRENARRIDTLLMGNRNAGST